MLTEIDLSVPTGQALGIVGPNGAAKSTLLSVINGTERASAGSVVFAGRDVIKLGPEIRARQNRSNLSDPATNCEHDGL